MTEHSSVPFVFFFLSEYSSIVMFSAITVILFLGGYNFPEIFRNESIFNLQSIILGLKTCFFCFVFVWFLSSNIAVKVVNSIRQNRLRSGIEPKHHPIRQL